eukprot:347496_1
MSHPTYRDLTKRFKQIRNGYKSDYIHGAEKSASHESGKSLLLNMDNTSNRKDTGNTIKAGLPPIWMELLESVDDDILKIQHQIGSLKEYHTQRKRVMFEDAKSAEYDANIQETTRSITRLFQGCKTKLQKIALKGNEDGHAGYEDRSVRYNVMRSRATTIQEWTKKFREAQRNYLQEMKAKELKSSKYIDNDSIAQTLPDLDNIADGFDAEQLQRLELIEQNASERTQEILNIAKSVHELATLFQELSVLVVEQGSLLDRIDYNVEQTLDNLSKAKGHIDKANVHQKRSRTALCIIVLIMLILVAGFILFLRHVSK